MITNAASLALQVADVTRGAPFLRLLEQLVTTPSVTEREKLADELHSIASSWVWDTGQLAAGFALTVRAALSTADPEPPSVAAD